MSGRAVRSRTAIVGASCVVHLGLIAALVLAEEWILSAHASKPPVLPIELVTAAEPPPTVEPPPVPPLPAPKTEPRRSPRPPRPVRLPRPIDKPIANVSEPTSPAEPRPEPAMTPPPAPAATAPAPPPTLPPAPSPALASALPGGAPRPAPPPAGAGVLAHATDPAGSTDGIPIGRPAAAAPGTAVASAPSRDTGATGAVTRVARPQGGYQVRPGYPASARRLGAQGVTLLKVHVLADGRVGDVAVQETAGHPDLDQAAADAVRRWRFDPARRGDEPVAMWVLLPVEFRLK
jgi:protein TonB